MRCEDLRKGDVREEICGNIAAPAAEKPKPEATEGKLQ